MGIQPPPQKGGGAPQIFGPCLLWPNGWMDQDDTWHGGRPQPRRLCVRRGPSPSPKRGRSPLTNFRPISIVAKRLDASRCYLVVDMEEGVSLGDFVLDGYPAPFSNPQFSAHVYCDQTAAWIKMALGTKVGLGPGHILLDGDPAPIPKKGAEPPPPIFGPFLLWPNGLMHQDATWYGGRPQPR